MNALNPFPGYPVATIAGHLDWTATTEEVSQARRVAEDFVSQWQSGSLAARRKTPDNGPSGPDQSAVTAPPSDRAAIVQISGDYGAGKTHVLLEIDKTLREGFAGRKIRKVNMLRLAGLEADPASWYQNSIGPVLNDLGGRSPDGGWFARLAVDVYAEAARAFLPEPWDLTEPAMAFQLVRSGVLNASAIDHAYADLITKACEKFSESVRSQFIALLDRGRRTDAEQWLSGNAASVDVTDSGNISGFRDGEAIDVLAAAAALSVRVGAPFAILIDEIELFLRVDDRSGKEVNATWLKRLLGELANAGAFVAISGHRSTWDRRADFLQRFSFGKRIEMRRLLAEDVLGIVSQRVGTNPDVVFDRTEAEAVAEATRGNMRRVLSLCRVLFDQSAGFTKPLEAQEIKDKAVELSQAPKPDQVLLKVQEVFEERKLSIDRDLLRTRQLNFDFDLVARSGAKSYFIVMVRPTPNVKEAQDFARQFLAQLSTVKRMGERFSALFICDTPADRDYVAKANEPSEIDFDWIDYTDARFINEVAQAVDRQRATEQVPGDDARSREAARVSDLADFESTWSKRLDAIDRRRTAELNDLQGRLALALQVAEAASKAAEKAAEARSADTSSPGSLSVAQQAADVTTGSSDGEPSGGIAVQPFSAADLFEKPTLGFRLRLLLKPNLVVVIMLVCLGFLMMLFASDIGRSASLFLDPTLTRVVLEVVGALLIVAMLALLLRDFFAIEDYFDHASHLIKEYYLAAPHPRVLAGANRLARELILLRGPKAALVMFKDELEELVENSQRKSHPAAAGFAYPAPYHAQGPAASSSTPPG